MSVFTEKTYQFH